MITYNITVSVEESIKSDWLNWMITEHIPQVMSCGFFTKAKISKIITEVDSNYTFAVAYSSLTIKHLHQYQVNFARELQKKHKARYGDKAVAFRTIMETIAEF